MAKKKISSELEEAILSLSQKEKNKLLIRLINKDELLVEQLQFKLLEGSETDLKYRVTNIIEAINLTFSTQSIRYFKDLIYYTRELVTLINRHFKVTKDKKGELELLIHLFKVANTASSNLKINLRDFTSKSKYKEYSLTKVAKMETLLKAIHEDYKIEFEEDFEEINDFIRKM